MGRVGAGVRFVGVEDFLRGGRVTVEDEDFEASTRPGEVIAHTANGVGLDHGLNTGFGKSGDSEFGVRTVSVFLNNNELGVIHGGSIRLRSVRAAPVQVLNPYRGRRPAAEGGPYIT